MSQWNNTYAYNNQYQGSASWNGDVNAQYVNQPYYPGAQYESNNQYVSFNEFLSQMQGNQAAAPAAADFNSVQYQNYAGSQYNYQNVPSTSQNTHDNYNYGQNAASSNGVETYQTQSQYNQALPEAHAVNEVLFKSNLTPTATEFVPKNPSVKPPPSNQNVKAESSKSKNGVKESKSTHGSSSDTNWRERPQPSSQNGSSRSDYKNNDRQDSNNYRQDSSNHNRDSNNRNEYNQRDSSNRNYDRNHEYNNRTDSRYEGRNQEANNRYENRYNERGQKSKSKNKDSERTFYNSSVPKEGRSGREGSGRSRNFPGSSRLRAVERNTMEDEQYANNYLQFKEEKMERAVKERDISSPKNKSNKNSAEQGGKVPGKKEMTQRERLSEQLDKGTLECLVCCERVKQTDAVWSCANCYHVLHLRCIRKWATSSLVEGKWRCPACQNTSSTVPSEYRCLCGAVRSPEWSRGSSGAHTCGKNCRRPRSCPHPCSLNCHPGPCPPCTATVTKPCGCGVESRTVMCSNKSPLLCGRVCDRTLPCGTHKCAKECHEGACGDCTETITQLCYCSQAVTRVVACTTESTGVQRWGCGAQCTYVRSCGVHVCGQRCHAPPCLPCPRRPQAVLTCPCGNTQINPEARKHCTDPIPLCDNICTKPLPCGPPNDKHFCKIPCHEGDCPECPEKTLLPCRCGHTSREVPCTELAETSNNITCQKKCNKKLSCGRHRCRAVCCAESTHRCGVVCGRLLPCQLHRCEQFCHTGHCPPCPILSFEELTCECGKEVILPPVRCGTKPPACSADCGRVRPCGHPPHHACHAGDCPPCVVLTTKMCYGQHEERKTIPCSQEEFSCGLPCGKPLPCGKHTCIKICHKGPCDTSKCTQPCTEKRPSCGHECAAPCHAAAPPSVPGAPPACPSAAPCRRAVRATCPCGRRHLARACHDNARDLAKIMSALAATKMQEGGSVDISEMRPGAMLKTLECDDECRVEARTRQLALALQIRNPDVSAKLAPRYSEHVRATAAREPSFAQQIHDKLTELVQLAKKSKQKTRSHSFPSMNWQKRQFIHELCEHFGCESVAYDAEPNRNVVATADKEKSWLPAMSVLEVLAREAGKRRVPGPVLRAPASAGLPAAAYTAHTNTKTTGGWATLTSTNAWAARSQAKPTTSTSSSAPAPASACAPAPSPAPAKIDYFDNPPEN